MVGAGKMPFVAAHAMHADYGGLMGLENGITWNDPVSDNGHIRYAGGPSYFPETDDLKWWVP